MRWPEHRRVTGLQLIIGCVGLAVSASQAHGQQANPDAGAPPPEPAPAASEPLEVVISGSRMEEPARDAMTATDVIRRPEIERSGARNAAEVLEEYPGVAIVQSFAGSELWLRGLDPEHALILVDGDRIPGQINGAVDLTRYGVENIERIEIVRGPGSALYGSDAIGGVVDIVTRESKRDLDADASVSYGQRHLLDLSARAAGKLLPPLRLQWTGGFHRADAFGGDASGTASGSARTQGSSGIKLSFEPDSRQRLVARADYLKLSLDGVDSGAGGAVFDRNQLQEQLKASLEHRVRPNPRVQLLSRATYSQFREQYLEDQRGGSELDRYEDNREHLAQFTSVFRLDWSEAQRSILGLEHLFQSLDSERLSDRGNRYRLAGFIQQEWKVWSAGDARFDVVPGARLDLDSQFGSQVSPKLALRFMPSAALELRASYGRGFRAPSFQELLLRFDNPSVGYVVAGNPELGAENSHGVDAGFAWKPEAWLELSAAFFRNDLRNMIAIVSTGSSTVGMGYTYGNLTRAWTTGVDSSAVLRASDVLSLRLGHTLLETWDAEEQRALEGRPRHRLTATTRLAIRDWDAELNARASLLIGRVFYVLGQDEVERAQTADPLARVDLRISKRFTSHVELAVGIDNLLGAGERYSVVRPFTLYAALSGRY